MEPPEGQIIELVGGPDDGLMLEVEQGLEFQAIWLPRQGQYKSLFEVGSVTDLMKSKYEFRDTTPNGIKRYHYDLAASNAGPVQES